MFFSSSTVWKYHAGEDSVLEVTEESYRSCNMSKPITKHDEGHTEIKLNHSGAFYFISGKKEHCEKGQKLAMVVMSRHHHHHHEPNNILAPAPTPAPADQPRPLAGTACGLSKNKLGMFAVGIGSLVTNYMLMF
ncbi:early nodulin-like protein 1 [Morus notabilis]|nr:early nodulin-like protein 1 [Morus notabilis]